MSFEVTLPWPPRVLSPNVRTHWTAKSKAAKAYRAACAMLCKEAKLEAPKTEGKIHFWVTFYPPDKRHRDDDNAFASFKSGRDGVADALGIDDKRFASHPFLHSEIGGMVKVRLSTGPEVIE